MLTCQYKIAAAYCFLFYLITLKHNSKALEVEHLCFPLCPPFFFFFSSYKSHVTSDLMKFQNELIIQIMTESHEIDNLKRKVEDAKMKLVTEIKVTDLV